MAELRRESLVWWHYRVGEMSTLLMSTFIFPLLMVLFNAIAMEYGGGYGPAEQLNSLLGYLMWFLCFGILGALPSMVTEAMGKGTFEKLMTLPVPSQKFIVLRGASLLAKQAIYTAILAIVTSALLGLSLPYHPAILVIVLITVLGSFGIGLGLSGITLIKKRMNNLVSLISYLALLVTGALIPLDSIGVVFDVMKLVLPTALGIDLIRSLANGTSFSTLVTNGSFFILVIQNVLFVILGLYTWVRYMHLAKLSGELGQY